MPVRRVTVNLIVLAALVLSAVMLPTSAQAKPPAPGGSQASSAASITCNLPESNAEALEILSNYYPGYWWDHAHLTIAVQAAPNVSARQLQAIHTAIDTWSR
ncbi:MAG TPA: hypothetical protein VK900_14395, partial [Anaerolineales bacterium]|nr:hypothetical protein [Anaerolineales bacterium]